MNRSILKRTIIGLALCVGVGVLAYGWDWYCNNPDGKVDQVQLSIEVTELYTEDDIRGACTAVEAAFKEYKGCTLYQLRYSDEECVHIIDIRVISLSHFDISCAACCYYMWCRMWCQCFRSFLWYPPQNE